MSDEKKAFLVIADISGYTKFMVSSKSELHHGQIIITELLQSVVSHAQIPLEISKLEGDAVFMYSLANVNTTNSNAEWLSKQLPLFFVSFKKKLNELISSNMCACKTCDNIAQLKLKIVVHYGNALFYNIGKFEELSGLDVIIAHVLLKNSVKENEYLLVSQQALDKLPTLQKLENTKIVEKYDDIGEIHSHLIKPTELEKNIHSMIITKKHTKFDKVKVLLRLLFKSALLKLGLLRYSPFKNL